MAITVRQAVQKALKIIGHVNSKGAVDDNREAKYLSVGVSYADDIQNEILMRENFFRYDNPLAYTDNGDGTYTALDRPSISSLDDSFACSDDSATRVIPTALAMKFSLLDRDSERYNILSQDYYGNLLPSVSPAPIMVTDYYGVQSDPDFQ